MLIAWAAGVDPEVTSRDTHRLGYGRVDEDPNISVLIQTMDATMAGHRPAAGLGTAAAPLREGERLLDVGCGLGDAALGLAEDLGPAGELVGVYASP